MSFTVEAWILPAVCVYIDHSHLLSVYTATILTCCLFCLKYRSITCTSYDRDVIVSLAIWQCFSDYYATHAALLESPLSTAEHFSIASRNFNQWKTGVELCTHWCMKKTLTNKFLQPSTINQHCQLLSMLTDYSWPVLWDQHVYKCKRLHVCAAIRKVQPPLVFLSIHRDETRAMNWNVG